MKTRTYKGTILLSLCLIVGQAATSFACQGGICGGGGNPIESGFRVTLLKHLSTLQSLTKAAKEKLNFNVDELAASVNNEGGFFALCAPTEQLTILRKMRKKAFVFPREPNTVYLNCTDMELDQWAPLFDSNEAKEVAYFIHEGLRTSGKEGENDFHFSGTVYEALRTQDQIVSSTVAKAFNGELTKCRISTNTTIIGTTNLSVEKTGDYRSVNLLSVYLFKQWTQAANHESLGAIQNQILQGPGYTKFVSQIVTRQSLYNFLLINGCLDDQKN